MTLSRDAYAISHNYAAKSDGIDARAAVRLSSHIYTAGLHQSIVHRLATAAGWLIRLPVLHDTRRPVSKQRVGLGHVCTLKKQIGGRKGRARSTMSP